MKKLGILVLLLAAALSASAHVINYEVEQLSKGGVVWKYIAAGFTHIIPLGLDHILFIACIFFLNKDIKKVVLQASMFTLAHSVTLGLAMYGVINPPANVIEPLIALSIAMLAVENMLSEKVKPWRLAMVFVFGLIHGMGFAGALSEFGLPSYAFATALISFNVGVELGQLAIIGALYFLVSRIFSQKLWYRKAIVIPASVVIASVALYWTVERMM
ncbi:MAG: HupE/UreJ family protein [Bacteroidota bacterium]